MATSNTPRPRRARAAKAHAEATVASESAPAEPVKGIAPARRVPAKTNAPAAKKAAAKKAAAKKVAAKKTAIGKPAAAKQARRAATKPAAEPAAAAPARQRNRRPKAGTQALPAASPSGVAPPTAGAAAPSTLRLVDGDERHVVWHPGSACPGELAEAARACTDAAGRLPPDSDEAVPRLLRLAAESTHRIAVDEAVWPHLAQRRDMRHRLALLEAAYPGGAGGAALRALLKVTLAPYQLEGALWSVVAGRALLADERGLGKGVQAIAAARLWQHHFGLRRVLVLCAPAQRLAWQRAWHRIAGVTAQVMDGAAHQRAAQWRADPEVRILAPEALAGDIATFADWAPQLLIVDEPQLLGLRPSDWAALDAPHALVLCGAALDEQPALLNALVEWLDRDRLGPLAALREVQAARERGTALSDATIERLDAQLSRLLLERQHAEVAEVLPPRIYSERMLTLGAAQREAHDRAFAAAQRLLAGWRSARWLSDSDQWQLGRALGAMRTACHRTDPLDPSSALAEASVQALQGQLDDWAGSGAVAVALCCDRDADRAQLALRLGARPGLELLGPGEPVPAHSEAVLRLGVPWCPDADERGDDRAARGRRWMLVVALDTIESGLFDTLAGRRGVPLGAADGGESGFLQGESLAAWLHAVAAALAAATLPTGPPAAVA